MGDYLGGADYGEPGAEDELGVTRHIARPNPASPFPPVTLRGVGQPSSSSPGTSSAPVDKEKAQPNAGTNDAAGISPGIARPSSSPPMGPLSLRRQADEAKLAAAEKSGSGISRLPGPARIPLRILETLGSVVSPASMAMIPGTSLHHSAELGSMRRNIASDVGEQEAEARTANLQSEATSRQTADEKLKQALMTHGYQLAQDEQGNPTLTRVPGFVDPAQEKLTQALLTKGYTLGKDEAGNPILNEVPGFREPHPPLGDAAAEQYNASILRELNVNPKTAQKQIPPEYKVLPTDTDAQAKEKMQRAKDLVAGATGQQHVTVQTGEKNTARSDKSYQFNSTQLEKLRTPIEQKVDRLSTLASNINLQSPQADSLLAPEVLSVSAGGQGSGLRMNEAEISRIVGGATVWTQLKTALNKWSLDPEHAQFTDEQRQQMFAIAQVAQKKYQQKLQILNDAEQALLESDNPAEHRQITVKAKKDMDAVDSGILAQAEKDQLKPPGEPKAGMKWQHRTVNGKVEWREVPQ